MQQETRDDVLRRLAYIEGHLRGVRRMVEDDTYCIDVMKQTYAVRRAIEKVEEAMFASHLRSCVVDGIRTGEADRVIDELVELHQLEKR